VNARKIAAYVARYLLEGDDVDYYAKTFADRLILRVFNAPALMSHLRNLAVLDSQQEGVPQGSYKFQLKFNRLPDEVIPQVKRLIGVPSVKVVEFEEAHMACTGFEFVLEQSDLDFSQKSPRKLSTSGKGVSVFPEPGGQPPVVG
jgi:hypothetical protein